MANNQNNPRRRRIPDPPVPKNPSIRGPKPPVKKPTVRVSRLVSELIERSTRPPTLFVLDTNVLMHDPTSLFRFQEHDIYIPMGVLEELDQNKKGVTEVARNARQVSRFLDEIISADGTDMKHGISLTARSREAATGRLFFQTEPTRNNIAQSLPQSKVDNQILGVVLELKQEKEQPVVLVSKDINMRIKARALHLQAEDYHNDMVMEDADLLYSGSLALPDDFWNAHGKELRVEKRSGGRVCYTFSGPLVPSLLVNQYVYLEDGTKPLDAIVTEVDGKKAAITTLADHTHAKNNVWGITARNREQNFALNVLLDPDIDFVTLLGQAGTGKTLLTLAAALELTLNRKIYSDIIMTRVTVPVGEDIGFLPGTEEEKMTPWMGAMDDNLDVLSASTSLDASKEHHRFREQSPDASTAMAATRDLIRTRLKVKSLNFMRGRTFLKKFLIIDEAQNLTPKQMKTLITRAGPGTKVVCLGNIAQIDTPYLTEGSSGLTYVVDRFKGWKHGGHITLAKGERSRLADHAAATL